MKPLKLNPDVELERDERAWKRLLRALYGKRKKKR